MPDPDALLRELDLLFRDADSLHDGWSCPTSNECCRFGITGREPYVTSIEIAAIERAVARRGGPLSRARRALPLVRGDAAERACPLLDQGGRCSVYAHRPLGCRTFYCGRAQAGADVPRAALGDLVRRLRALALRHRPDGDQPRPLGRVLGV